MRTEWQVQDLREDISVSDNSVFLDENAELIYVFKPGSISAFSIPISNSGANLQWTVRCPEWITQPVRGCVAHCVPVAVTSSEISTPRTSVLAILQGNDVIHLLDVNSGQSFIQAVPPTSGRLLGFMWTSCPAAQFVIVTTLGLRCFTLRTQALHSSKQSKALEETANTDLSAVLWYKYQHHSRLLLLGTQFDLIVMQITGQRGISRLKRFNLSKIYARVATAATVGPENMVIVRSQQSIAGANGTRMYVCVVDTTREAIHVLSLSLTEVTYLGDIEWPTIAEPQPSSSVLQLSDLQFQVYDNLVVMHCLPLGTATLFDFLLPPSLPCDGSAVPLLDPVARTGPCSEGSSSAPPAPPADSVYMPPCHALHLESLQLYKLKLDLKHCLKETQLPAGKKFLCLSERSESLWPWMREEQLASLRQFLQESASLQYVMRVFDSINARFLAHARMNSGGDLPVLKPTEVVSEVLLWLHDGQLVDPVMMEAFVSSYGLSARSHGIAVPPLHGALLLQCISAQGKDLQSEIVMRGMSSSWCKPVMAHTLEEYAKHRSPPSTWMWCSRLWARLMLYGNASSAHRIVGRVAVSHADKAAAIAGYVRCLVAQKDVAGAALGLRDSLGPRDEEAARAVMDSAVNMDPLVQEAVGRCCMLTSPDLE